MGQLHATAVRPRLAVGGEGPVVLRVARVVVVREGDRALRHPAHEPRRPPRGVPQPPELRVLDCALQDARGVAVQVEVFPKAKAC